MIIVGAKLHCWPSSAPDEDKIWKNCLDLFSHFQDQIVLLIQDFLSLRRELRIGSWRVLLHFRRRGRLKQKLSQGNQQEKTLRWCQLLHTERGLNENKLNDEDIANQSDDASTNITFAWTNEPTCSFSFCTCSIWMNSRGRGFVGSKDFGRS